MSSTGGNGGGLVNRGVNDSESNSSLEAEGSKGHSGNLKIPRPSYIVNSPVLDSFGVVPSKALGYSNSTSENPISKDFSENPVRDSCDAGFQKKSGGSNSASEVPISTGYSMVTLEISRNSLSSRTEQLRQEDGVEVCSVCSEYSSLTYSSYRSDATSSMVTNNGILEVPNAQQTNVRIRNVNNMTHQQFITDDGTKHLIRHTEKVMKGVKSYFDISHTKAWKTVLDTDKIVFLVGFSGSFKNLISLKFYEKYKARRVDVFRLNGAEDLKICYKRSKPFAIFMEDAFGPFGTNFESISRAIKNLASDEHLEAALFMMDPLSFERNKESVKRCIKRRLADHVVHLEEKEYFLSEIEKREILEKTRELVNKNGRSLTKEDIDKISCFENPLFFDSCEEFVVYNRHDKNVCHFFPCHWIVWLVTLSI